jgi:hypothetical protein
MFQSDTDPQRLDQTMREQLSQSLEYIFDTIRNRLDIDLNQCDRASEIIRTNKVSPKIFARYYDLVFAVNADNFTLAQRLVDEILSILNDSVQFEIIPYSKIVLGDDYERYPRLVFTNYSSNNPMDSPNQDLCAAHTEKLELAIEIIRTVDSDIYREIQDLLLQVIITVNSEQFKSARPYAGASSFMTWGAIFINANLYVTKYQIVEFFVHELTHCVLFGYSCINPLVLNPVSESYQSPLRNDSRPMDGIFHATLVCARIVQFMKKWETYGTIDIAHASWLEQTHTTYLQKFFDGVAVIKKNGQLSNKGSLFLEEAEYSLSKYI